MPITPSCFFAQLNFSLELRKMPQKCLLFVKTALLFFNFFLKSGKIALFKNMIEKQNHCKGFGDSAVCGVTGPLRPLSCSSNHCPINALCWAVTTGQTRIRVPYPLSFEGKRKRRKKWLDFAK